MTTRPLGGIVYTEDNMVISPTELAAAVAAVDRGRRAAKTMGVDPAPHALAQRMVAACLMWSEAVAEGRDGPETASRLLSEVLGTQARVGGVSIPSVEGWRLAAGERAAREASSSAPRNRLYHNEV